MKDSFHNNIEYGNYEVHKMDAVKYVSWSSRFCCQVGSEMWSDHDQTGCDQVKQVVLIQSCSTAWIFSSMNNENRLIQLLTCWKQTIGRRWGQYRGEFVGQRNRLPQYSFTKITINTSVTLTTSTQFHPLGCSPCTSDAIKGVVVTRGHFLFGLFDWFYSLVRSAILLLALLLNTSFFSFLLPVDPSTTVGWGKGEPPVVLLYTKLLHTHHMMSMWWSCVLHYNVHSVYD